MRFPIAFLYVVVSLLIMAGCKSLEPTSIEESPPLASEELLSAVLAGKIETVKSRLRSGESVNAADKGGKPILQLAILNGHENMVELLLQNGADPTIRDLWNYNWNALEFAAYVGHSRSVKTLLGSKAKFGRRVMSESLHIAAGEGCLECVKLLLEAGANVNHKADNTPGSTPLIEAIDKRHYEIARYLLGKGADTELRDTLGNTVLDYVEPSDAENVKALLEQSR